MPKKDLFIGNYKVRNCLQYGEYKIISSLGLGDDVILDYLPADKLIVVKDSGGKVILGELEVPEHIRKVLAPLLQGNHKNDLLECAVSQADKHLSIDNRIRISIWAKK